NVLCSRSHLFSAPVNGEQLRTEADARRPTPRPSRRLRPTGAKARSFRACSWLMLSNSKFQILNSEFLRTCLLQERFHAGPTLPRRFFRRAGAAPVCLQRDRAAIAVLFQRTKLTGPVDDAPTHGHPFPAGTVRL